MDKKHIVITGGAGFVGGELSKVFLARGERVTVLDLVKPKTPIEGVHYLQVDLLKEVVPENISDASAIVHLSGASIFNRWTPEYKKLIYDSRIVTAQKMVEFFKDKKERPKVFVSASAVGIYGSRGEEFLNEESTPGGDFLAHVCVDWEKAASAMGAYGTRTVSIRTGIVLGHGGGMLAKLVPIFKWGLGGPMGDGKQWFSFISMTDLLGVYEMAVYNESLLGPVNAVSPEPIRNRDLARALGRMLHRPAFIPVPRFVLRIVLGEFAEAVLASQRVVPNKLRKIHFQYKASTIDEALN
ncbi:MAG: TIGR01777 family oxidoreductase [Candidatus Paceibacteria bacterium]